MKLLVISAIFIAIFSVPQKKDLVVNDDNIRFIINRRHMDRNWDFPKIKLDSKTYKRILISKNLLDPDEASPIQIYKLSKEDGYRDVDFYDENPYHNQYLDVKPTEKQDYFVYRLKDFPEKHLFLVFDVPSGEAPLPSYLCGFEVKIL